MKTITCPKCGGPTLRGALHGLLSGAEFFVEHAGKRCTVDQTVNLHSENTQLGTTEHMVVAVNRDAAGNPVNSIWYTAVGLALSQNPDATFLKRTARTAGISEFV